MNHLLITLLSLNQQINSLPHYTLPARKSNKTTPVYLMAPTAHDRFITGNSGNVGEPDNHPRRPSNKFTGAISGLWLPSLAALVVLIAAVVIFGAQQVRHERERVRWAQQLQEREHDIQRLRREQQVLAVTLAVKTAEWAHVEATRNASAKGPFIAGIKR